MEVLDNYNDATATVAWKKVTDIYYPSKSRVVLSNVKSMSKSERKVYPFTWSALAAQSNSLLDFAEFQRRHFPDSMLLSVLETTRGCPYGCTYCDWGGGVSTTVLQKSPDNVKQDIDALMLFNLTYIYLADANFGIFGQRDVDIMQYIAYKKIKTKQWFGVGFGGYAKTENKLKFIREILKIDIENNISMTKELKLSMQTLDDEVLDNIDRKNISLDKQLEIYQPLASNTKLPLYVEMIMGLPGINLDKYYHELDVLGQHHLSVQWFEWILLPETPAYSRDYRTRFGIKTTIKKKGWAVWEEGSEREVVVASDSFTDRDYMQMILSNSLYHLFVLGGYYKKSIEWIRFNHNIGHGQLARDIYENFFDDNEVYPQWQTIATDPNVPCVFDVCGQEVYGAYYFVARVFLDLAFSYNLVAYLQSKYNIPTDIIASEAELNINANNYGKTRWQNLYKISYKKDISFQEDNVHSMIGAFRTYIDAGNTIRGKKKLLGLFNVDN
jgi:MoaA/NifB/PqqE/SkfB family radical SAM enzyme